MDQVNKTVTVETRLLQVVLGTGHQIISTETIHSKEQHMPPHSPSSQLLYLMVGLGVRIIVVETISIEIMGSNKAICKVLESPPRAVELEGELKFVGEDIRATCMPN